MTAYKFTKAQLNEIHKGMRSVIDQNIYARPCYDSCQMEQIRLGLEEGLDVSSFADRDLDWMQMSQLRKGIGNGVDVRARIEEHIRRSGLEGMSIRDYDAWQLCLVREAMEDRMPQELVERCMDPSLDIEKVASLFEKIEQEARRYERN